jgi:hypothetical protein
MKDRGRRKPFHGKPINRAHSGILAAEPQMRWKYSALSVRREPYEKVYSRLGADQTVKSGSNSTSKPEASRSHARSCINLFTWKLAMEEHMVHIYSGRRPPRGIVLNISEVILVMFLFPCMVMS